MRRFLSVLLLSAVALCTPSLSSAQDLGESKIQAFSGYSGYRAGGTVNGVRVPDFTVGWADQLIFKANHWAAFVVDVNGHYNDFASAHDLAFGPRFQFPLGHFIPFVDASTGLQHFSPKGLPSQNAATYIFGAGIDVKVNSRFSIRPFQISYINTYYSALSPSQAQGNYFNGVRVQAGMIYNLRWFSPPAAIASCSAEPSMVDSGDPVKIGVTAKGFRHKRTLHYLYATTGGAIAGNTATESVDTAGVRPGDYTVSAEVTDDGDGKHQQTAKCEAKFSVNAKQSTPSASAEQAKQSSASPASAEQAKQQPSSSIVADQAKQPSAPSASAGQTNQPTSSTVAVEQAKQSSAPPLSAAPDSGKVGDVSATTATAQTPEKVNALKASKFGTISFKRDLKRPTRVDNEAKGELDRYADALAAKPDVKGVVVGYAAAKEDKDSEKVSSFASLRAVNTKDYVTKEKGIDAVRVEPRTGSGEGKKVDLWIVPAGARLAADGTIIVDENKVRAVPRVALKLRNAHKKIHKQVIRKRYAKKRHSIPAEIHRASNIGSAPQAGR